MQISQIQYTVKDNFVSRNRENIVRVMAELRKLNPKELRYSSFLKKDGKTFVHLVIGSKESTELITGLESFQKFLSDLQKSGVEIQPEFSELILVGSSVDLV